ncbi:hypothetical protein B0H13DRAFT_2685594 [Mycena leptocephala]|nr:hypothetical protein B0H13DRAFT_2685594 [Mycena leptocephala]
MHNRARLPYLQFPTPWAGRSPYLPLLARGAPAADNPTSNGSYVPIIYVSKSARRCAPTESDFDHLAPVHATAVSTAHVSPSLTHYRGTTQHSTSRCTPPTAGGDTRRVASGR